MSTATANVTVKNMLSTNIKPQDSVNWSGKFTTPPTQEIFPDKDYVVNHEGQPVTGAGFAFSARNQEGEEWYWITAWEYNVETSVVKIWNGFQSPGEIDWDSVRGQLKAVKDVQAVASGLKADLNAADPDASHVILRATISYSG